jgi:hypothetical protein
MRVIAAVIILFIPATFTAVSNSQLMTMFDPYMSLQTFFSITFFNYSCHPPKDSGYETQQQQHNRYVAGLRFRPRADPEA